MKNGIVLFCSVWMFINSASCQDSISLKRYEFSHIQMGTSFKITCYSEHEARAMELAKKAFSTLDTLNYIFSDYLAGSELNSICQKAGNGQFIPVSPTMSDLVIKSINWGNISNGAFDITIGPLTQLWRRAARSDSFPDSITVQSARSNVGLYYLSLDTIHSFIKLEKPGMMLDFGGIAKGYAVDQVYKIFADGGVPVTLVDGGGDIYAGNAPPGEEGWKIALKNHEASDSLIIIKDQAIATSGDLYRYFEYQGKKYSHIIDPGTGYGITIPRIVTVISKNAESADVLATVFSILGPEKGSVFIKSLPMEVKIIITQEIEGELEKWVVENKMK